MSNMYRGARAQLRDVTLQKHIRFSFEKRAPQLDMDTKRLRVLRGTVR